MSEPRPSDELISAHLDGEAAPDVDAAVEASASGRARRDELDAVRASVGRPVVPPPGARDDAVAAALAVFDTEIAPSLEGPVHLADRRDRRRPALLPVLGAAASIILVVAVAFVALRPRGHVENTASAGAELSQNAPPDLAAPGAPGTAAVQPGAAAGGGDGQSLAEQAARERAPLAASASPADLGEVADAAALRRLVAARLAAAPPPVPSAAPSPSFGADAVAPAAPCEAGQRAADPGLGPLVLSATAQYGGKPVRVLAYRREPTGPVRAVLTEPATCQVLLVDPG